MKNVKKILLFVAIVVMAVVCFVVSASALDATGQCGDNVFWEYDAETGDLVISGSGAMWDYTDGSGGSDSLFWESSMKSIVINNGVTTIGNGALYGCNSLTEVTIPDSVTKIGVEAFCGCSALTNVTIGNSVTTIGDGAFFWCESLESITVDENNLSFSSDEYGVLFNKDRTKLIQYPVGNRRTSYTIPDNVKTIGKYAFNNCNSLSTITIPDGVTEICVFAFYNCKSLTSITIHNNVTTLGKSAFRGCDSLTDVYYSGTEEQWNKIVIDSGNDDLTDTNIHFNYAPGSITKPSSITPVQSASAIKLTWPAVPDAAGYRVYQKADNGWKALGNVAKTSATLTKLTAGTKYTYAVQAIFRVNGALTLADDYTTINTATKAIAPTKITSAQNTTAIRLTWSKCPGATDYQIFYKTSTGWNLCVKSTTATSHTFTGLKAGSKFTFAVRPYILTDSEVVWSDYTTYTASTLPAAPKTAVTSPASGKITVKWNAVSGADGYQVYYKTGNGSYKLYKTYTAVQNLNFSGLKSGTKYTFAVRAGIRISGGNIFGGYKEVSVTVK